MTKKYDQKINCHKRKIDQDAVKKYNKKVLKERRLSKKMLTAAANKCT
jgi:hypothetical protein